jgi:hypothetical protein
VLAIVSASAQNQLLTEHHPDCCGSPNMAKKVELEDAYARYGASCDAVARHEAERALHDAVREAEDGLSLVHPAVTYQRRFLKTETPAAPTLDCLFRYAPPLFLKSALDAVERWYAAGTRTERTTLAEFPERLATARRQLAEAVELWSILASGTGAKLVLDGRAPDATAVVAVWVRIGAVAETRHPDQVAYTRVSDPRRPVKGKCSACGRVLGAPLARLLDPFPCPGCRKPCSFVIVGRIE